MEGGRQEGEARAAYSTNKPHVVCSRLVQTDLKGSSRIGGVSIPPPILQLNYLKYDLVDRSRQVFSKFPGEFISPKAFRWLPTRINLINQDV